VDLAQLAFAVDVVAVLGSIAVARRPGNRLDELRPVNLPQSLQLVVQPFVAARRSVILEVARQCGFGGGVGVVFAVGFLRERLAHRASDSGGQRLSPAASGLQPGLHAAAGTEKLPNPGRSVRIRSIRCYLPGMRVPRSSARMLKVQACPPSGCRTTRAGS